MNSLSSYAEWGVKSADAMAGFKIVRAIPVHEARNILHRVEREELTHFQIDDKQPDPQNPLFQWSGRGYRTGPVSVLAVETAPGTVACIWFIGANWRNAISADVVWAEELRRPRMK